MKNQYYSILYEDDQILVLNKNSGVLSIPDRFNRFYPNLYHILRKIYGKIFVVHRLDRDTSGIMMFAKTEEAHRQMNIDFETDKVRRIYHIVVQGVIQQDNFEIDIPLKQSKKHPGTTIPSAKGKPSLTLVRVLERFRNQSFCECELKTGRHHQIRVHLQTIGHPLLVDELYGNSSAFFLSSIKKRLNLKKDTEELPLISRLTMHSYKLEFNHPISSDFISIEAPYQKDFSALLQVLRKYSKL